MERRVWGIVEPRIWEKQFHFHPQQGSGGCTGVHPTRLYVFGGFGGSARIHFLGNHVIHAPWYKQCDPWNTGVNVWFVLPAVDQARSQWELDSTKVTLCHRLCSCSLWTGFLCTGVEGIHSGGLRIGSLLVCKLYGAVGFIRRWSTVFTGVVQSLMC